MIRGLEHLCDGDRLPATLPSSSAMLSEYRWAPNEFMVSFRIQVR